MITSEAHRFFKPPLHQHDWNCGPSGVVEHDVHAHVSKQHDDDVVSCPAVVFGKLSSI